MTNFSRRVNANKRNPSDDTGNFSRSSGNSKWFSVQCHFCGNRGHRKQDCPKFKEKKFQERIHIVEEELRLPEDAEDFLEPEVARESDQSLNELGFMTHENPICDTQDTINSVTQPIKM